MEEIEGEGGGIFKFKSDRVHGKGFTDVNRLDFGKIRHILVIIPSKFAIYATYHV